MGGPVASGAVCLFIEGSRHGVPHPPPKSAEYLRLTTMTFVPPR